MFRLEAIGGGAFHGDRTLLATLGEIAAPSYENVMPLLEREFEYCDQLDIGYAGARPTAFFLTHKEELADGAGILHGVYCGMVAAAAEAKGHGAVVAVIGERFRQVNDWLSRKSAPGWFYGTTASPSVLQLIARFGLDLEPRVGCPIASELLPLLAAIKRSRPTFPWPLAGDDDHPLVLRGVATVRYSAAERERIARTRPEDCVLTRLGVREEDGDRVMFLARLRATAEVRWRRREVATRSELT